MEPQFQIKVNKKSSRCVVGMIFLPGNDWVGDVSFRVKGGILKILQYVQNDSHFILVITVRVEQPIIIQKT